MPSETNVQAGMVHVLVVCCGEVGQEVADDDAEVPLQRVEESRGGVTGSRRGGGRSGLWIEARRHLSEGKTVNPSRSSEPPVCRGDTMVGLLGQGISISIGQRGLGSSLGCL